MENNAEQPAYPVEVSIQEDGTIVGLQTGNNSGMCKGLTKRELIAAMMAQGLAANSIAGTQHRPDNLIREALELTDELLTQLNNKKDGK